MIGQSLHSKYMLRESTALAMRIPHEKDTWQTENMDHFQVYARQRDSPMLAPLVRQWAR